MKIEAVVFDLAGTVLDFGSLAPAEALRELFVNSGIDLSDEEIRKPMGVEKRSHITQLLEMPRVRQAWIDSHGAAPTEADIDVLYERFLPIQIERINANAELVPGVSELVNVLQRKGIRIGATTGYARSMIEELLQTCKERGFSPDVVVAGDEASPRPSAAGALKSLVHLDVSAVSRAVKVDDTQAGIAEGLNAGMWTVAVVLSGNALGIAESTWRALSEDDQEALRAAGYQRMQEYGAHYVIDTVAALPEAIQDMETRLSKGETP